MGFGLSLVKFRWILVEMTRPRICVLRAPGTNCDVETAHAFNRAGGQADRVHLFSALENPKLLDEYQVLCVPGGFSYGDDIGAGVIFSQALKGNLAETITRFLQRDTLVLGICNGFQELWKAGIVPHGAQWPPVEERDATLTWNENGKYTALWVRLKNQSPQNVFLAGIDEIELPIAHAEGQFILRDPSRVDDLLKAGQVALCYIPRTGPARGDPTAAGFDYPDNRNGAMAIIAALSDPTGRVLGLMPHPERFIDATQHPQWTRRELAEEGEGMMIFRNAIDYFSRM